MAEFPTALDMVAVDIHNALNATLPYAALILALTVPHIASALDEEDNRSDGNDYKRWYARWVEPKFYGFISAEACYSLRCGMVHQGQGIVTGGGPSARGAPPVRRIIFITAPPPSWTFHLNQADDCLQVDLRQFCDAFLQGLQEWWTAEGNAQNVQRNLEHVLRYYPSCVIHGFDLGPALGSVEGTRMRR